MNRQLISVIALGSLYCLQPPQPQLSLSVPIHLLQCQQVRLFKVVQKQALWEVKWRGKGVEECLQTIDADWRCERRQEALQCNLVDRYHLRGP